MKTFVSILLIVLGSVCAAQAHVAVLGSRGPFPHDPAFLKADGKNPCPADVNEDARYEVFAGSSFPLSWSLFVNHNNPPNNPVGYVNFNYFKGNVTQGGNYTQLGQEPITTQHTNLYWTFEAQIPADYSGDASIQIFYDLNGAGGVYPGYYQCIDLYVLSPTTFE